MGRLGQLGWLGLTALLGLASPACATSATGATHTEPASRTGVAASTPAPITRREVPPGHLRREDVMAVLSDGPPSVLQRVEVDPVIDTKGQFLGWRVLSVNDPDWATGEVHKNDVIVQVNGRLVQDPNQFFDVFQSLALAPALVLAIRRNGQDMEVRYPIDDDPTSPPLPHPTLATSATREVRPSSGSASSNVSSTATDPGANGPATDMAPASDPAPGTQPARKRPASRTLGGK